jgi:hypothetical protein
LIKLHYFFSFSFSFLDRAGPETVHGGGSRLAKEMSLSTSRGTKGKAYY